MSKKLPMVGNPYVEILQNAGAGYGAEVLAQLAIAHEQRTANLIAYIETFGGGIEHEDIWNDIRARLGIGENK